MSGKRHVFSRPSTVVSSPFVIHLESQNALLDLCNRAFDKLCNGVSPYDVIFLMVNEIRKMGAN